MKSQDSPYGFLLIDKPESWTSHDVVGYLRKATGVKKIGHAGTLDPFATGLLIVGIGRQATKRLDEFKNMPKEYETTLRLGTISDTYDKTGKITKITDLRLEITDETIEKTLQKFIGKQKQVPPMYSAKKVAGKKLYELARKGIEIKIQPVEIEIYSVEKLTIRNDLLKIRVKCSSGTYIRTLVHDIGQALGVGAYCVELRRTKIGVYSVNDAAKPEKIIFDRDLKMV